MSPVTFKRCLNTLKKLQEETEKKFKEENPKCTNSKFSGFEIDGDNIIGNMEMTCNRGCCTEIWSFWFGDWYFEKED